MRVDESLQQRELDKIQNDWQQFRVNYNAYFLSTFKRSVPASARAWDESDKCWYVAPEFVPDVERLIKRYFTVKHGVDWPSAWDILHLQKEDAPAHLIECAAACLSRNENSELRRLRIETARELLLTL